MIVVIKSITGNFDKIEGESAAEKGSIVSITHRGREIGTGEVVGFKRDNRANRRICRFANKVDA